MSPIRKNIFTWIMLFIVGLCFYVFLSVHFDTPFRAADGLMLGVSPLWYLALWYWNHRRIVKDEKRNREDEKRDRELEERFADDPKMTSRVAYFKKVLDDLADPPKLQRTKLIVHFTFPAVATVLLIWAFVSNWSIMLLSGPEQWVGYWNLLIWILVALLISCTGRLSVVKELTFHIYLWMYGTQELEEWKKKNLR